MPTFKYPLSLPLKVQGIVPVQAVKRGQQNAVDQSPDIRLLNHLSQLFSELLEKWNHSPQTGTGEGSTGDAERERMSGGSPLEPDGGEREKKRETGESGTPSTFRKAGSVTSVVLQGSSSTYILQVYSTQTQYASSEQPQ